MLKAPKKQETLLEGFLGLAAILLVAAAGLVIYKSTMRALRGEGGVSLPMARGNGPWQREAPLEAPPEACKLVKVAIVQAPPFVKNAEKGKSYPPVLIYVSYLGRNGLSVKDRLDCHWKWTPPVWTLTGDERGVLRIGDYPWTAELYGPAGTAYTVSALEPESGLSASLEIELVGDPEARSKERRPIVVEKERKTR